MILETAADRLPQPREPHGRLQERLRRRSPERWARYTPAGTPGRAPCFVAPPCRHEPAAPSRESAGPPQASSRPPRGAGAPQRGVSGGGSLREKAPGRPKLSRGPLGGRERRSAASPGVVLSRQTPAQTHQQARPTAVSRIKNGDRSRRWSPCWSVCAQGAQAFLRRHRARPAMPRPSMPRAAGSGIFPSPVRLTLLLKLTR